FTDLRPRHGDCNFSERRCEEKNTLVSPPPFLDVWHSPYNPVTASYVHRRRFHMPIRELVPGPNPARDDVQQTAFTADVVGRYICNNWQELTAAQGPGAYPFDVVVIGAGMYGAYCAEKLYRFGGPAALRVLVLDGGEFLLQ